MRQPCSRCSLGDSSTSLREELSSVQSSASSAVVRRSLNCSSIKTSFWTSLPERSSATDNMPLMVSVELMQ